MSQCEMNDRAGPSRNELFNAGDVIKTRSRYTFLFLIGCPKCEVTGYDKSVVSSVTAVSYVSTYDTNVPVIRSPSFETLFWWLRLMCELSVVFSGDVVGQCIATCFTKGESIWRIISYSTVFVQ
jgi:hypothetical protein